MACPHSKSCPLHAQFLMQSVANYWIKAFCEGEYPTCERYKLSLSGKPVPITLLPNGQHLQVTPKKAS